MLGYYRTNDCVHKHCHQRVLNKYSVQTDIFSAMSQLLHTRLDSGVVPVQDGWIKVALDADVVACSEKRRGTTGNGTALGQQRASINAARQKTDGSK